MQAVLSATLPTHPHFLHRARLRGTVIAGHQRWRRQGVEVGTVSLQADAWVLPCFLSGDRHTRPQATEEWHTVRIRSSISRCWPTNRRRINMDSRSKTTWSPILIPCLSFSIVFTGELIFAWNPAGSDLRKSVTISPPSDKASDTLKCYYRPTASLQLNNKGNTKYNITVT